MTRIGISLLSSVILSLVLESPLTLDRMDVVLSDVTFCCESILLSIFPYSAMQTLPVAVDGADYLYLKCSVSKDLEAFVAAVVVTAVAISFRLRYLILLESTSLIN